MARKGILGTKLGMTQVFDENNRVVPVTVVKAGPTFEPIAENTLSDQFQASPAVSGGRIYFHGFGALYAVGAAGK